MRSIDQVLSAERRYAILLGDAAESLGALSSQSLDALICDPPCGLNILNQKWDNPRYMTDGPVCLEHRDREVFVAFLTKALREAIKVLKPGAHALIWSIPKTSHWTALAVENAGFELRDRVTHFYSAEEAVLQFLAGLSEEQLNAVARIYPDASSTIHLYGSGMPKGRQLGKVAEALTGMSESLKPSHECWILAKVPIKEKRISDNVLKYGTGALNIEDCRIPTDDCLSGGAYSQAGVKERHDGWGMRTGGAGPYVQPTGRFPANVILSHAPGCREDRCSLSCPVRMLNGQSPYATRFYQTFRPLYYASKPDADERNEGVTQADRLRVFDTLKDTATLTNDHRTVKSLDLMKYLVELVTPKNGVVLDCFMGSGSTGVAALLSDRRFVGIEQSARYCTIADARLRWALGNHG